ncbi:MAG: stage II sporulation protein M [Planctomycetota bacterium]|nr:stage II sporulation protein M [Planctomycetota bacterium]MDA1179925.1 stage II sporulation protein M [Planctomycetota bacterium]
MAKASRILERRQQDWSELASLCDSLESRQSSVKAHQRTRFALLYRGACADLALADRHQIPPRTVSYLHQLVSRAHNQLYRSRRFAYREWIQKLLHDVPFRVVHDRCVWISFALFWGLFLLSGYFAWNETIWPGFAQSILTDAMIDQIEESFSSPISADRAMANPFMASFYFKHNTGIGLQCFVGGALILPGLTIEASNAVQLGTIFGHMLRPDVAARNNFVTFVTAHGPFELTAIVVAAGAGLRMGWGWIASQGMQRLASLRATAVQSMPIMGSAIVMFFLAGMIESFVSGSALPYRFKLAIACLSGLLLVIYFFVLGRYKRVIA